MTSRSYEEFEEDIVEKEASQIDSRDTYVSRFSVTTRRVAGSGSKSPRAAITTNRHRMKNSEKIFSKSTSRENLGGGVNMSNINKAAGTRLVESKQAPAKVAVNNETVENKQPAKPKQSGLDSLFASTAVEEKPKTQTTKASEQQASAQKQVVAEQATAQSQIVPDQTKEHEVVRDEVGSSASSTSKIRKVDRNRDASNDKYQPQGHNRKLKVIKPISYNSAKEVSSALKANCAVVLCLKNTNDETAKRLLDFAFGAAAMCGAKVSLEAEKTYVITIGPGLSQREKLLCVKEGVPLQVESSE